MNKGIWIIEEHDGCATKNITLELLSEGHKLARRLDEPLCVCRLGTRAGQDIALLAQHGAEKIYAVENEALSGYNVDSYTSILCTLIEEHRPSIVMMGATPVGSELAPRVAARLGLPCVTEAKKITGSRENFQVTKAMYNEQVYATIKCGPESPLLVTIPPGETDITRSAAGEGPEVTIKELGVAETPRTRCRKFLKGDPKTIKIVEADRIVAIGRGAGKEGLPIVQELAELLGASIGGSRGAVDAGIVPYQRQIGISGKTVTPKLVIACAISGARQFTVGMENSDLVIALNLDEKARIFEYANLSIKGDVHQVLPQLITHLKKIRNNSPPDSRLPAGDRGDR